jgi:hypothetical protein
MNRALRGRRLAAFGLMSVLLIVAICTISTSVIIWHATTLADEAVHMSDLYQQAHYLVLAEASSLHEYALNPGSQGRDEFLAVQKQLVIALHTVATDGDAGDKAFVQRELVENARYLNKAAKVLRILSAVCSGVVPIVSRNNYTVLFGAGRYFFFLH